MRSAVIPGLRSFEPQLHRGRLSVSAELAVIAVLSVLAVAWTVSVFAAGGWADSGIDTLCYWSVNPANPYGGTYGGINFAYAPPLAIAFMPAKLLSFDAFHVLWLGVMGLSLVWLGGRFALMLLLFLPISVEMYDANIHLLMAVAVAASVRYPAAWSFLLLTKVTPGIGLLWYVVRREWRNLGIALGVTAAISLVSLAVAPGMWLQWLQFLASTPSGTTPFARLMPPLWLRLAAAAALVVWGARTDRRWTVVIAATIALPVLWLNGFAVLAGLMPSWREWLARTAREGRAERSAARGVIEPLAPGYAATDGTR